MACTAGRPRNRVPCARDRIGPGDPLRLKACADTTCATDYGAIRRERPARGACIDAGVSGESDTTAPLIAPTCSTTVVMEANRTGATDPAARKHCRSVLLGSAIARVARTLGERRSIVVGADGNFCSGREAGARAGVQYRGSAGDATVCRRGLFIEPAARLSHRIAPTRRGRHRDAWRFRE